MKREKKITIEKRREDSEWLWMGRGVGGAVERKWSGLDGEERGRERRASYVERKG